MAILLGVLEAAQGRFRYAHIPDARFWPEALARSMPSWLILAACYPLISFMARRFPVATRRWKLSLPLHLLAGTGYVIIHLGGSAWFASLRHVDSQSFTDHFLNFITRYTVVDYFVYGALVGMVQVAHQQTEMRRRAETEARLRQDLAEARLDALRHQLNPHFLFNTLNSISALALTGDRETLVRAVDALSDLLRVVLERSGAATTPLEAEMRFIDRYLEIQSIRFADRLAVERDVAAEALGAEVPTFLLQPLVENAITHGLGIRPGPGWLAIRARRQGEWLQLEVEDSGPGFGALAEPERPPGESRTGGVGLSNTRARLEHHYATHFTLECARGARGGALVRIRVPWAVPQNPTSPAGTA